MNKKIALACATLATAGLLLTGCWDTKLRKETCKELNKLPGKSYTINENDHTITASVTNGISFCYDDLEVKIRNNKTDDELIMVDEQAYLWYPSPIRLLFEGGNYGLLKGVDRVKCNGIPSITKGLDEKFDQALKKLKPELDQKIRQEMNGVKENCPFEQEIDNIWPSRNIEWIVLDYYSSKQDRIQISDVLPYEKGLELNYNIRSSGDDHNVQLFLLAYDDTSKRFFTKFLGYTALSKGNNERSLQVEEKYLLNEKGIMPNKIHFYLLLLDVAIMDDKKNLEEAQKADGIKGVGYKRYTPLKSTGGNYNGK